MNKQLFIVSDYLGLNLVINSINAGFTFFDIFFVILAGMPLNVEQTMYLFRISKNKGCAVTSITYGMGYVLSHMTLYFGK